MVAYNGFSNTFNPFSVSSKNDTDVLEMTMVKLLTIDRNGEVIKQAISGESTEYNNKLYKYTGIADFKIYVSENGEVDIEFNLRKDVKFSDGTLLTADDVIFSMYVLSDPSYKGPFGFSTLPIIGMDEYKADISPNISGIQRVDDYTIKIRFSNFDESLMSQLNIYIASLKYYGDADKYNYSENSFGFEKGNITEITDITTPFGAGPYKFTSYDEGVISFSRNEHYYKGKPKLEYVNFTEFNENDIIFHLINNRADIARLPLNKYNYDAICGVDSVKDGFVLYTSFYEIDKYEYIGISARAVSDGVSINSESSKYLRMAFAVLLAENRRNYIEKNFGDCIGLTDGYFSYIHSDIYSKDINGNKIYNDEMTEEQRIDAAKTAATDYFTASGQLKNNNSYAVGLVTDKEGNHPLYSMFETLKSQLSDIGVSFDIKVYTNETDLYTALSNGEIQFWNGSVSQLNDETLYQRYHSSNIYGIEDEKLDELIDNIAGFKCDYDDYISSCFAIIYEWIVEIPVYKHTEVVVFNEQAILSSSYHGNYTNHFSWINEIHNIEITSNF